MQKTQVLALTAFSLICAVLVLSSASAYSIFSPQYESYHLSTNSYGHTAGTYSSTSTYEKVSTENEDRYGSDSSTVIKRTESETFIPATTTQTHYVYSYDNSNYGNAPRYIYTDNLGYTQSFHPHTIEIQNNVLVDYHGRMVPSTNWRFKETYNSNDYPNENEYGYDYYYQPRYDWHQQVYNWRY